MKFTAPAKINLNLHITGCREGDGYHLLDSVMVFTHWGDEITITPAEQFTLTADGAYSNIFTGDLLSTKRGAPNLIVRAVYMMADHAVIDPKIHIHVTKNIPAGAGLGGGSSDAAAVMHALNDMWSLNLSMDELCAMGLELGAELPVCLHAPHPCRVSGIGDVIEPIDIARLNLLITWPDVSLMTKDVFSVFKDSNTKKTKFKEVDAKKNNLKGFVSTSRNFANFVLRTENDLTDAAISLCPEIGDLVTALQTSEGCQTASMSGSGSACFGVFETLDQAEAAKPQFKNVVVTVTRN